MNPTRGRHGTRQKGICGARLAYASRYRSTLVRAVVSRSLLTSGSRSCSLRPTSAKWLPLGEGNVDDQIPMTTNVGILEEKAAATHLAVGLLHRGNVVALFGQVRFIADLLQGIQDRLVGILRADTMLPAGDHIDTGVDVIAV